MSQEARYNEVIRQRRLRSMGVEDTPDDTVDLSGPIGGGVAERDWLGHSNLTQNDNVEGLEPVGKQPTAENTGMKMADSMVPASGDPKLDTISGGLMMSGNPYAMAAGLALKTAGAIKAGQNQRAQSKYLAEVEKVKMRQNAINQMSQIGQGLKA